MIDSKRELGKVFSGVIYVYVLHLHLQGIQLAYHTLHPRYRFTVYF